MPYSKPSDLPNNIKDPLPPSAQEMWRKMFNKAHESCMRNKGKDCESIARIAAWVKVKKYYKKSKDGKWTKKD